MPRSRRLAAAVVLTTLVLPGSARTAPAADDDVVARAPYVGWLPGAAPDDRTVFAVLDGRTGTPLEGVRVRRCLEPELAPDGTWGPTRAEATTDRFGLVAFDLAASGGTTSSHWTFERAGYAPNERYGGALQDTMTLYPGVDLHGRLRAPMGGPAPGVTVAWTRGCEHAPALRRVTTDADGRFVIPCAASAGALAFEGPGIRAQLVDAAWALAPTPGAARPVRLSPAGALVGRVVAADPTTLAGAVVVVEDSGRGPCAPVASDGTFRVEGGASYAKVRLARGLDETIATLEAGSVRPGGPFRWDLRPTSAAPALVDVAVRVACRGDARPPGDVERIEVRLDGEADGRRVAATATPDGARLVARLRVAPGRYAASAASREWVARDVPEDGPFGRWAAPPRVVDVAGPAPVVVDLTLDPQPAVVLASAAAPARLPDREAYVLVTPIGGPALGLDAASPNLHLPADLEAVVWTRRGPFPLGPVRDGVRTAIVDTRPDARIRLRDIGYPEDVRIDGASAEWEWFDTFAEVRLVGVAGRHRVAITEREGGHATAEVDVAGGPDAVVEVAAAAWQRAVAADVVVAPLPGDPPPRVDVFALLDHEETIAEGLPGGVHRSPSLSEGTWIRVEADGYAPLRRRLTGAGPWPVAFDTATLVVTLRGDAVADPVDALVDGWTPSSACWTRAEGSARAPEVRLTVRGLAAGEHTILVGTEAHGAVALRARLAEGATRTIDVDLPSR